MILIPGTHLVPGRRFLTDLSPERFIKLQNVYFSANCMIRGDLDVLICPNVEFVMLVPWIPWPEFIKRPNHKIFIRCLVSGYFDKYI
jgi:hypothetical protein